MQSVKKINPAKKEKENISDMVVEYILLQNNEELSNLTVKNIARTFSMNPSYLSRKFLKDKKFSLGFHILRMKVFRAASLLKDDKSITIMELASRMGFCTTGYFIHVFKKFFGTSPGKFKEIIR